MTETQLITLDSEPLSVDIADHTHTLIKARAQGTPVAYLTGRREFYSLNLKINEHVLIPRPETELLVDTALHAIRGLSAPRILDLGTGSGAIAIAIADNHDDARIVATDCSEHALQLASENAEQHLSGNILFVRSDWYSQLGTRKFDLIVSNPPYIDPDDPHLQRGDLRFEPRHALISEQQGYADLITIIAQAPLYLKPGGQIILEHGYNQGEAVRKILKENDFTAIDTLKDLNKLERLTVGCKP
jgi:release factor glutamine methyltransferase